MLDRICEVWVREDLLCIRKGGSSGGSKEKGRAEKHRGVWGMGIKLVRLSPAQGRTSEETAEWPEETRQGKTDVSE